MTNREFFETVAAMTETNPELAAFAQETLEKMSKATAARNSKAAAKRAEKQAEEAPICEAIVAALTSEPKTATTLITEAGVTVTPQKASFMLRPFVNEGKVVKELIAIPEKKSKVVGYRLA